MRTICLPLALSLLGSLDRLSAMRSPSAQGDWRRIDAAVPRGEYDPGTGAIVGVLLHEVASWDGAETRVVAELPGTEFGYACVRDRVRDGFLVVTSDGNQVVRSRILRDGVLGPPLAGSLAGFGVYAWDPVGARTLFLPEYGSGPGFAAFDGASWTLLRPATMPPARGRAAMATDTVRNRVVLFGGHDNGWAPLDDTWEWDGTDWTRVSTATTPAARTWHGMAFDERIGRTVLFGGVGNAGVLLETWEYDGVDWRRVAAPVQPEGAITPALAFFPPAGGTVAYGGEVGREIDGSVWRYDGSTWAPEPARAMPRPRLDAGVVTDLLRRRLVLFGGRDGQPNIPAWFGDTWEWDGYRWRRGVPSPAAPAPAPRGNAALVFDVLRGNVVLFGGGTSSRFTGPTLFEDTWTYDGARWTQVATFGPAARTGHAMAFHLPSFRTVLFGGQDASGAALGDTWEFDGTAWTARTPGLPSSPPARMGHGLAYDPVRGELVLFGGTDTSGQPLGDTWTLGATWTQRSQAGPAARTDAVVATDLPRGRVLLAGGHDALGRIDDTWSWDGAAWVREATTGPSAWRNRGANDPTSGRVVTRPDLWSPIEVFTPTPATATAYAQGCPGSSGMPVLRAVGAPRLGEGAFAVRVDAARANALVGIAIDTQQVVAPIGSGCWRTLGTPNGSGFAFASPAGHASFAVPVPPTPALRGWNVFLQAAVLDPRGALGGLLALTQGLQLRLGD